MKMISLALLALLMTSCASLQCGDYQGKEKEECIAKVQSSGAFFGANSASNAATDAGNHLMMNPPPSPPPMMP